MSEPKPGDLQVWWIPQLPMKAFRRRVSDLQQAKFLLGTLADYDLFQLENNIKPDYCNVGGLEVFDGAEWNDWCNEECDDFYEWMENNL
jgi:hypothetical protein